MKRWMFACCLVAGMAPARALAQEKPASPLLPYVAVHEPQFIGVREATFMGPDDRIIGLTDGTTAKAYPAGILSQHGLVEDTTRSGPIAVTW
jgi:hypothetical protein